MYVKIFLVGWKEIFIYRHLFLLPTCSTSSPRLETEQSINLVEDSTQIIINVYSFLLAEQSHFLSHSLFINMATKLFTICFNFLWKEIIWQFSLFVYNFWLPRSICSCQSLFSVLIAFYFYQTQTEEKRKSYVKDFFFHDFPNKSYPKYLGVFYYLCNMFEHVHTQK